MGSGKSYCGKKIAVHLGVPFIDLDEEIEKAEKKSISNLFAEEGEVEFRKMEASALRAFVEKYSIDNSSVNAVVSCGGGTPCYHDNMDFMNQHGLTVWMNPAIEILVDRLKKAQDHRPLIAGMSEDELEKFITSKLAERVSFYSKATLHINNSECSVDLIEKKLKNE
jgi:shikimate kinase